MNHFRLSNTRNFLLTAAIFAWTAFGVAQNQFHIEQRWTIGGEGSWDYLTVDAIAHRLYIAHQTQVNVIDLNTGKSVGAIQGLSRCHGIVISTDGKTGYISDGGANNVVVFDPATLAKTGSISAGTNPDGILCEPTTNTLWAFNGGSKNATVIDVSTRRGKKMGITDSHSGKSMGNPNIGDGSDAVAYDVSNKLVFSSNDDGTLSIIDAGKPGYPVIQTLRTMKGARTMAFDPSTGEVYTTSAKLGALPAANPAVHHNRPTAIPGTFTVLVIGRD